MKKIYAILLAMVMIATLFIGCSKEESEAVNATTEITTVETVDEIVDNLTEDVSVEDKTTDEEGNEVVVGKDADGNTVEIKTNSDGTITKTVTDKETGQQTEQTTAVPTTAKQTTTAKSSGSSQTTTKKTETTTRKQTAAQTTTKPAATTAKPATTAHTHSWTAVYKTEPVYETQKVLVKAAYDEPVYTDEQCYYCSACGLELTQLAWKADISISAATVYHSCPEHPKYNTVVPACQVGDYAPLASGDELGKPNFIKIQTGTVHHDAVYENKQVQTGTKKVLTGYKCSCGATKSA